MCKNTRTHSHSPAAEKVKVVKKLTVTVSPWSIVPVAMATVRVALPSFSFTM